MSDTKKTINDLSTTQSALGSVNIMVQPKSGTNTLEKMDGALVAPKSDITALIDGTTVAKKAEKDASGNTITTTYATKTELEAEETARSDGDSLLNNRVTSNSNRIANLEEKAGDYSIVQYRGTDAVPTGKAKYGLVKSIVGKTRAWNQIYNWNGVENQNNVSATVVNGLITLSGTANATNIGTRLGWTDLVVPTGHKVLITKDFDLPSKSFILDQYNGFSYLSVIDRIFTCTAGFLIPQLYTINGTSYDGITGHLYIYDLTLIFGSGNEPSTVADALSQLPALGEYNAYDAGSLVDTEVSGVEAIGFNRWDEEWEVGDISTAYGTDIPSNDYIRGINYCPCSGLTTYYGKTSSRIWLYWYDASKNYIGFTSGGFANDTVQSPIGAKFFRLVQAGTSYSNNTCININSSLNGTYKPYVATSTLSLPETVTLRSAGSVADELDVESGEIVRNSIEIDLTTLTQSGVLWVGENNVAYPYGTNNVIMICSNPKYTRGNWNTIGSVNNEIAVSTSGMIAICLLDTSETPTGKIVIRRYEPTTESIDHIPDNTIYTEGGGTIDTIQTQTPIIDNCLDVGYLAV